MWVEVQIKGRWSTESLLLLQARLKSFDSRSASNRRSTVELSGPVALLARLDPDNASPKGSPVCRSLDGQRYYHLTRRHSYTDRERLREIPSFSFSIVYDDRICRAGAFCAFKSITSLRTLVDGCLHGAYNIQDRVYNTIFRLSLLLLLWTV